MVRGSAIRMTRLDRKGAVPSPVEYAVSKSVTKVTINEVTVANSNEVLSTPEEERRIRLPRPTQTIRHTVDIEFLRVDPRLFSLISGVKILYRGGDPAGSGFDIGGFDLHPFDEVEVVYVPTEGSTYDPNEVVGFDADTRIPVASFALEVWSKLDQAASRVPVPGFGEGSFGEMAFGSLSNCESRRWGYTLFPRLMGGYISGFQFANKTVSFTLKGAQTRRAPRWGVGPHDIEGPYQRLIEPVSRNTSWRTLITSGAPPTQIDGTQKFIDALDNGTAADPLPGPDVPVTVDSGGATTDAFIIDGGRA